MRPGRDEIIICTGVTIKGGAQIWGDLATSLFVEPQAALKCVAPGAAQRAPRRAGVLHLDFNPNMEDNDGLPGPRNRA